MAAKIIEGELIGTGMSFAIVVARFNEFITSKLLGACLDTLRRHGVDEESVDVIWCPGSYEIPFVAKQAAQTSRYDAVICLGAVIRGATTHYDLVAGECAKGIASVGMDTGIPTIFGVITTENIEQAIERAGTKAGNKGVDAAMAAIEMASLKRELSAMGAGSKVATSARKS